MSNSIIFYLLNFPMQPIPSLHYRIVITPLGLFRPSTQSFSCISFPGLASYGDLDCCSLSPLASGHLGLTLTAVSETPLIPSWAGFPNLDPRIFLA